MARSQAQLSTRLGLSGPASTSAANSDRATAVASERGGALGLIAGPRHEPSPQPPSWPPALPTRPSSWTATEQASRHCGLALRREVAWPLAERTLRAAPAGARALRARQALGTNHGHERAWGNRRPTSTRVAITGVTCTQHQQKHTSGFREQQDDMQPMVLDMACKLPSNTIRATLHSKRRMGAGGQASKAPTPTAPSPPSPMGAGGQASKARTPTATSPSSPTRNPLCFSPWPYTRGALRSYGRVRAEGRSPMLERQSTSKLGVARCGAHGPTRQIIVHVALPPAPLCCRLSAWPCPLALALGCHDDELDAPPSSAGLKFAGKEGSKLA